MMFDRCFMYQTDDRRPECHCSIMAELPSGDVFGAWYAGTREGLPDVVLMAARWRREEGCWTEPRVLCDTPDLPEGNPIAFMEPGGRLHMFFVTIVGDGWASAQLKSMTSKDEGESWTEPVVVGEPLGTMVRNKPLYLDDGRIVLPMYDDTDATSFMYLSDDGGETWRQSGRIAYHGGCTQPTLFRKSGGTIVAFLRNSEPRYIQRSESNDRGETWSACASTFLPNPDAGIDLVELSSGHLLLAFNDSRERRTPLSLAWSEDEGDDWLLKLDLETEDAGFAYPAIIQARDGLIHLSYTWRRKAIAHTILDEEWFLAHAQKRTRGE